MQTEREKRGMDKETMTQEPQWMKVPELMDREWLIDQFRSGKTLREIAAELKISHNTVGKAVSHWKIKRPFGIVNNNDLNQKLGKIKD